MSARRVVVVDEGLAFDQAACQEFLAAVAASEGRGPEGRIAVGLSGGRTPVGLFRELTKTAVDCSRFELFWCDERAVPPDHADSNYRGAQWGLISRCKIDPARVHRMEGELPAEDAARRYDELLAKLAPKGLDLAVLGLGSDGHTASLFPASPALDSVARACASKAPDGQPRVTLTPSYLALAARHIMLAGGVEKKAVMKRALADDAALPITRVKPQTEAVWIVGRDANP